MYTFDRNAQSNEVSLMHNFEEQPLVTPGSVWRAAGETGYTGSRTMDELEAAEEIRPTRTKSGRVMLTIPDARKLYEALRAERRVIAV